MSSTWGPSFIPDLFWGILIYFHLLKLSNAKVRMSLLIKAYFVLNLFQGFFVLKINIYRTNVFMSDPEISIFNLKCLKRTQS